MSGTWWIETLRGGGGGGGGGGDSGSGGSGDVCWLPFEGIESGGAWVLFCGKLFAVQLCKRESDSSREILSDSTY